MKMYKKFIERVGTVTPFCIPSRRFVIYGAIVALGVFALYRLGADFRDTYAVNTETIVAFIERTGSLSWIVFAVIVALAVMSPLPSSAMGLVGGYLFDPAIALLLIAVGELVGATANYIIGRHIIGSVVTKDRFPALWEKLGRYTEYMTERTVFLLGLVPAGTANITGYTAGLVRLPYRTYICAWIAGIMSLSVLTTYLGHSARKENIILSIILGAGIIGMLVYGKKYLAWFSKKLEQVLGGE